VRVSRGHSRGGDKFGRQALWFTQMFLFPPVAAFYKPETCAPPGVALVRSAKARGSHPTGSRVKYRWRCMT
jgi:hypothetical protein